MKLFNKSRIIASIGDEVYYDKKTNSIIGISRETKKENIILTVDAYDTIISIFSDKYPNISTEKEIQHLLGGFIVEVINEKLSKT